MGFFWSNSSSSSNSPKDTPEKEAPPAPAPSIAEPEPIPAPQSEPTSKKAPTPADEDAAIEAYFANLEAQEEQHREEHFFAAVRRSMEGRSSADAENLPPVKKPRWEKNKQGNMLEDGTFPTEMNCLTAFDNMYYCYSFGGQFLNVYRYGTWKDCSEKSADWRFCLKTKMLGPTARAAAIQQHYRHKAEEKKKQASSEDIWEARTRPVKNPWGIEDEKPMQE